MKPTRLDLILIAAVLAVAILFGVAMLFLRSAGAMEVTVEIDGQTVAILRLDTDTELPLSTGHTVIVKNGAVYVAQAPCRDLICEKTPPADRAGDTIVCLPCKVIITVREAEEGRE